MKKRTIMYFCFLVILLLAITGCSSQKENTEEGSHKTGHEASHVANGDLRELTSSVDQLPVFLNDKPEDMQVIYMAAAKHQELLEAMPCYCGCAESADHKSNSDCFVFENKKNGGVVWDDHGTRCGVCLEIAAESVLQYKDGKSIKDIREYIDDKYKTGYAKPTPTPMPS